MTWLYNGEPFTEEMVEDWFGFVYIIINNTNNKRYIGKKLFTSAGYKTVKGKRKKIRKSSDWEKYWGSSKLVQEDVKLLGQENFTREIVRLCKNRSECSYYEAKMIFETDAILSDEYYNDWVTVKVSSVHVKAIPKTTS
jgi:Putative endonuclease segE, GIY-YIG domain